MTLFLIIPGSCATASSIYLVLNRLALAGSTTN